MSVFVSFSTTSPFAVAWGKIGQMSSFCCHKLSQFKRLSGKSFEITEKTFWVRLFNRDFGLIFMLKEIIFIL